jgi:ectoine hydroxylase-related dioxygenase (phytanoyl-CoA dioxygenase family)
MVGFIFMIDEFRPENGVTRFLPGSHGMLEASNMLEASVPACGLAGSVIIYTTAQSGMHGPNLTEVPRRSIQRCVRPKNGATCLGLALARPDVLSRLSPPATYLLNL